MGAPAAFELTRRLPSPLLAGLAREVVGYRETASGVFFQREAAPLTVPLIVSLGTPFLIALDREPGAADRQPSFAAGLHPGPVHIRSDGAAECVQLDLTPLGAFRLFGGALPELAGRMVDIEALFGADGRRLRDRIGAEPCWDRRFDMLEGFVAARLHHTPSPEIAFAWRHLLRHGGAAPMAGLAAEIGWSRQHLSARFTAQIGLGPKAVARMLRFHRACRLARQGTGGWAAIAAEAGYADQAHLAREFARLAGEPPSAWLRRHA
jgi:AraC-like DNA-binding protein